MHEEPLNTLTAAQAAHLLRAGRISAEALMRSCLDRIQAREADVGAWECIDPDRALEAARAADRRGARGVLHGVPFAVKDIVDTVDFPTALGSPIYRGRRTSWDASCVAALRAAGGLVLGKTVTTEFAYFLPGKTRNPHDLRRTPGGSSSGTAAAVADCMVPVGFGSQTAASLTRPAAYCGVFGYKASLGAFSLSGIRPFAESFDSLGVMARSVEDLALVRAALLGADAFAWQPWQGRPPRFGLCRTPSWPLAGRNAQAAFARASEGLAAAGAAVEEIALPPAFDDLVDAHKTIMAFEAARNYVYEETCHPDLLSEKFRELLAAGRAVTLEQYRNTKRRQADACAALEPIFRRVDALVAPSAQDEAPLADTGTGDPVFSRMWTLLGGPSVSVPVLRGERGLPVGVQLVGLAGDDDRLLHLADWAAHAAAAGGGKD